MSSVKIRLLNDAGYMFLGCLSFPVEVNAVRRGNEFSISVGELKRIGACDEASVKGKEFWYFSAHECQVVSSVERKPSMTIEMYKMLESVADELYMLIDEVNDQRASRITNQTECEPDYHDMKTVHEIQCLLAEARGVGIESS